MTKVELYEQEKLAFSIENYEELVVKNKTHEVRTRQDLPVRIICTDIMGDFPVAGVIRFDSSEALERYNEKGQYYRNGDQFYHDLFICPLPPKTLGFVAVYNDGSLSGHEGTLARLDYKNSNYKYALEYFADGSTKTHFPK